MLGAGFKSVPGSAAVPVVPGGVLAEDVGGQSKISGEILTLTPGGLGGLGGGSLGCCHPVTPAQAGVQSNNVSPGGRPLISLDSRFHGNGEGLGSE